MSITPVGGWNRPDEGEVQQPLRNYARTASTNHVIVYEKKNGSAFSKAFFACLGIVCAIVFVVFALGIVGRVISSPHTLDPTTASTTKPLLNVSAATLNAAYEANEPAADNRYTGRPLRVHSYVQSIEKDAWGSIYVVLADGEFIGVNATLNNSDANNEEAPNLIRGQPIVVLCQNVQRFGAIVMLRNCDLMNEDSTP